MTSRTNLISRLWKQGAEPMGILMNLGLRKSLNGCQSVLDVGCGVCMTVRNLGVPQSTGLDGYEPSVKKARELNTHDEIKLGSVCDLAASFPPKQFDACMAMDVIEHLPKEGGYKLMQEMETIARKRVVFFTPSGFKPQGHAEAGDLQAHLSGWEPNEMRAKGYKVIGALGPKGLRGEYHRLKYKPKVFWGLVALVCHLLWTRWRPESAAAILCVKTLDRS